MSNEDIPITPYNFRENVNSWRDFYGKHILRGADSAISKPESKIQDWLHSTDAGEQALFELGFKLARNNKR